MCKQCSDGSFRSGQRRWCQAARAQFDYLVKPHATDHVRIFFRPPFSPSIPHPAFPLSFLPLPSSLPPPLTSTPSSLSLLGGAEEGMFSVPA